ncbi:MAG TPA: acyclic terpene utilization AtuA family protein [Rhodopila sp.]|uniref:acyclic terpene utilization AtuA family protein n=1 Tax=Rhodopila sp. TaxID=2480087 RepID=UPI002C3225EA|nr:acyclic terpene utilization AtuA family protein [Rhodopila sp.]HVY17429.1 acyclic terpene utilization AtuA family protein [Rhodopila sp.]
MAKDRIRIGCGAGFADDRIPPGVEIVERGELDYLAMECLAERTIARETLDKKKDPDKGYTPVLLERMEAIFPPALKKGIKVVTNMGAANPMGAAKAVRRQARDWGCGDYRCAVVVGDEVSDLMRQHPELPLMEDGAPLETLLPNMASANAYLGADMVAKGFATGAELVITGRVADPALFLGPMLHAFGWSYDDYAKLANGTLAGHLLECSGQLTGGCFADPGKKEVEDLAGLGYPLADVWADGRVQVSKTPGSGGRLDVATCTEQLLYEMHDPSAYITPDCVLDASKVTFEQIAKDRVEFHGAAGKPRTPTLKVVVGYFDGYMGSGEMGFAGVNALARAKLGIEVVKERLRRRGLTYPEMRIDLIGMNSLHANAIDHLAEPYEVRLRIAARTPDRKAAEAVGAEVRSLHMQGPTGAGGGINFGAKQILAVKSVLIPRDWVRPEIVMETAA